ncbi:MAG: hybrid sensor histidine kinase/response regulator [Gammaproteobacteria bacterium]|nr:hybrid sensor histidine kinase/response regulator [Gammaproteobacteria bacterium]
MLDFIHQTILVVDDNKTNIKLVEEYLLSDATGYRIIRAISGEEALTACNENDVDLILLDIMMPGLDGYETCEILKSQDRTRSIPVVFLTAKHDSESIVKGFNVGAVDYLIKPINCQELLARVSTHLRLRNQEKLLIKHNNAKEKFISLIAENLNSPITGLTNILKMLNDSRDDMDTELMNEYLSLAYSASEGISALSHNLMQWSALKNGQMPAHSQAVDIKNVINEVNSGIQEEFKQKGITVDINVDDGLFVYMDDEYLRSIVRIILNNAFSYSHKGGAVVISLETVNDDDFIRISIADVGVGIDEPDQRRLFKLGERFQEKGTSGEMGSGMGLILCYDLIEKSNGSISLESSKGKGTTVFIDFPKAV